MVDIENEYVTQKIMIKFMKSIHHCKCFLFNHCIISFSIVELSQSIGIGLSHFPIRYYASIAPTTILKAYV
jgi:hypothetical protein